MNGTAGLGDLLLATLTSAAILCLVGTAGALALRRLWAHAPHLAAAYALLPVGFAGTVVFFAWVLSRRLGLLLGFAVVVLSLLVVVLRLVALRRSGELPGLLPPALRMAAVTGGILLFSLGLFLVWGGPADLFLLAQTRFSHPLPIDNQLPSYLAAHLLAGEDPRQPIATWLSSDRPPLQSGLLLLVQGNTPWLPVPPATQAFAASVVCQLTWVPGTYALTRSLRFSPRATLAATLFAGLSGTVLVNTTFTWPKLLSAAFVLAALAVAVEMGRRPGPNRAATVATAGLAIFGILSHGAAVFALPILAVVLWWSRRSLTVSGLAAGAGTAVVLYAPWLAYQRWYDPPGDRLLKWHLAGVTGLDHNSFLHDLITAYRSLPLRTIVEYKIANLKEPIQLPALADLRPDTLGTALRGAQFFTVLGALGLAVLPLVAMLATAAWRRWHGGLPASPASRSSGLMVACLAALVLWCLILFGPATTWVHSGSHVPILLALCLPCAWLADQHPRWAVLLGVAQLVVLLGLYLRPHFPGSLSATALTVTVAAGLLLVVVVVTAPRRMREPGGLPGAAEPATAGPADPARPEMTIPDQRVRGIDDAAGDRTGEALERTAPTQPDPVR